MATRSRILASMFFAIVFGTLPSTASALAIYHYEGLPFYRLGQLHRAGDRVTGELTFDEPLAPNLVSANLKLTLTDFHFNDGRFTYGTGNIGEVTLSTDEHGAIVGPFLVSMGEFGGITVAINQYGVVAEYQPGGPCVPGICDRSPARAEPGQWSQVPEPTSALLLMSGLVALASRSRRASGHAAGILR